MTFTTHTSPSATRIPLKNHYWKSSIFIRASLAFQKFSGTYQSLNNLGGTCRFKDKCDGSLLPKGLWKTMIMPLFGLPPSLFPPRVPNISLSLFVHKARCGAESFQEPPHAGKFPGCTGNNPQRKKRAETEERG